MLRLETRLDRRQLLKYGAGVVGGGLVLADNGGNSSHEYYANKELLERIVRDKPSPFVRNVAYDHTRSLEAKEYYTIFRRILDDQQALSYLARYRDFFGLSHLTEQDIVEMGELSPRVKDIAVFISSKVSGLRREPDDMYATVRIHPSDFGKGIRPDVFVFRDIFYRLFMSSPQGDIEIPVEGRLITTLEHDYTHAEDIFNGIDLGNGMVINATNYLNIDPRVEKFVMEERAYRRAMELAKREFGEDGVLCWYELGQLMINRSRTSGNLEGVTLNDYDRELVRLQMIKSDELEPEIKRFIEKFGK